ncbi:unnamed protein product [Peniophora sp. CBMAI 1063]|nr:unnamed protein product [Peniophora sp. CBMAI 1063]
MQLLAYFGTSSSTLDPCRDMCDNCIKAPYIRKLHVSATASNIVALFSSKPVLDTRGVNGIGKIINTLRGSSSEAVLPQKDNLGDLFGIASKVNYETVKAVFGMLLAHGVLRGIPDAKAGEAKWATNLKYSLGIRELETELYEDTDEHEQQQMILRTFVAAPTNSSTGEHDPAEQLQHTSVHRRRRRRRIVETSSESDVDPEDEDEGDGAFTDERPAITKKARGKLPQREVESPGSGRSSLSALTPVTPDSSQSSAASSLKRQRGPKISPRKRRRIESDDEVIEIFDSSDEDLVRPMPRRSAQSKAPPRPRQPEKSQKTVANERPNARGRRSREQDDPLVPEVDPPSKYAAAFEFLWGARRTAFERYAGRTGATNERDVLSDRALLALAVHLPFDCPAFAAALAGCETDPSSKWPLYGVYFRSVLKSKAFEKTLTAQESPSAAQVSE